MQPLADFTAWRHT